MLIANPLIAARRQTVGLTAAASGMRPSRGPFWRRSQIIFQTPQTATRLNETHRVSAKQAAKADGASKAQLRNRNK